jgi:branched-chain amino acid transport system permease protein
MFTFKSDGKLNLREVIPPIFAALVIVFVFIWPSIDRSVITLGSRILMFAILAVSWGIFSGPTKYISLAHAAFFGIGIYTTAILGGQVPIPILILLGGVSAFVVAVIMGSLTLRLRGVYFTIFTFGLGEILRNVLTYVELTTRGNLGRFQRLGVSREDVYSYLVVLLAILLVVAWFIKRSRFGNALVSIGESEDAAAHIGVNTTVVKVGMFAISSFFVGAVGATVALQRPYIDPPTTFEMGYSFMPVLMIIFGGMTNLAGGVVGATVFTYLQSVLLTRFPIGYPITIGAVMILAILFMPDGIVGLFIKAVDFIVSKVKKSTKVVLKWFEWDAVVLKLPLKFWLTLLGAALTLVFSLMVWVKGFGIMNFNLFSYWFRQYYFTWLYSGYDGYQSMRTSIPVLSVLLILAFVFLIVSLVRFKSRESAVLAYIGFGMAAFVSILYNVLHSDLLGMEMTIFPILTCAVAIISMVALVKRPAVVKVTGKNDAKLPAGEEGGPDNADS